MVLSKRRFPYPHPVANCRLHKSTADFDLQARQVATGSGQRNIHALNTYAVSGRLCLCPRVTRISMKHVAEIVPGTS